MKYLVISHKDCNDGFAAAWAWHYLKGDKDTVYHFAAYGSTPPWDMIDQHTMVFIFDFSYPRNLLSEIKERCLVLEVHDHHKTAEADLAGFPGAFFDMKRSGAGMAWDTLSQGRPRPWLIAYVEDRDLWNHKLPGTKEAMAYLLTVPKEFERWDAIAKDANSFITALTGGAVILGFIQQRNHDIAKEARFLHFEGYTVPVVNCNHFFASEVCDILDMEHPFAIAWSQDKNGLYRYSLRSAKQGHNVDVSAIAKRYGGGGHPNAAGFSTKENLFP